MYCKCATIVVGFSIEDYEKQLDLALSPLIDAAKLVVTRTSQVVIAVVVFVVAVHVASAVLRYYFRLAEASRDAVVGPRNVYVTAHAPPVVVGGVAGGGTDDDGAGTLTMRLRRPVATEVAQSGGAHRGEEYDSAGEDNLAGAAVSRRPPNPTESSSPSAGQLTLRTARRTSSTMTPQSSLDFKYSETKV